GPRFLRFIRKERVAERVLVEHRVMQHAATAGIPVPLPQVVDGHPFVRVASSLVQLYPWVEGRHAGPSPEDAYALGAMEAATHLALVDFADSAMLAVGSAGRADWDTEHAIQVLSRIDDLIRYYPSPGETQLHIQEQLRFQLQLLESSEPRSPSDFSSLQPLVCHGDYHSRNVLLGPEGNVSAVVDWEIASLVPPAFELIRALSFSGYLEPPLLDAYLRGYASHRRLSPEECALGVELWWQRRLHGTWVYRQRFIEGNRLVDRFLDEEAALLRRFADPAYREWLADELATAVA
ncbi:MAG: phosphotransferase, partial [Dehalococcoidia bacterium]